VTRGLKDFRHRFLLGQTRQLWRCIVPEMRGEDCPSNFIGEPS